MPARILPHLSNPRLAVYRAECGDPTDANVAALYAWQGELHAAWYEVLGYVEMMLRHSLDNALADWNVSNTFPAAAAENGSPMQPDHWTHSRPKWQKTPRAAPVARQHKELQHTPGPVPPSHTTTWSHN